MERDVRTTPPLLRWVGLGFLSVVLFYFLLCANTTFKSYATPFGRDHYWSAWMGSWWMFTKRSTQHTAIELEARRGVSWEDIDEAALFPTRWESGLRFERLFFRQVPYLSAVLAQATCTRLARAGEAAEAVRIQEVRWPKTLGSLEQPRKKDVKVSEVLVQPCSTNVPLPQGRRL